MLGPGGGDLAGDRGGAGAAVSRLQQQLDDGTVRLQQDRGHGYLPAVLKALNIPVSSQVLVFSKTSFQRDRISPYTPRAVYFSDDSYVAGVQDGDVLELSTAEPQLGGVFYLLKQDRVAPQKFLRQNFECLSCHSSSLTSYVPGHTVRSVFSLRDGQPAFSAGTYVTTDESPIEQRYGGWWVTGTHGQQYHMGNLTVKTEADANALDRAAGANVTSLKKYFDTTPYLSPHSDLVALMVLQHQTHLHNLITRAAHETRRALHYEQLLNRELGRSPAFRSESTTSRIRSVAEPLVRGLLFSGEAKLTHAVTGTSGFAAEFAQRGPFDDRKRSLRQFDLKERLFRYPCSYLIYSSAFEALPPEAKSYVYRRLQEVLSGKETAKEYAHLDPAERSAIREILLATKPDFAKALSCWGLPV